MRVNVRPLNRPIPLRPASELAAELHALWQRFTDLRMTVLAAEQDILKTARQGGLHGHRINLIRRRLNRVKIALQLPVVR